MATSTPTDADMREAERLLDPLTMSQIYDLVASLLAERREARERLEATLGTLIDLVRDGRIPRACGACGTPDAACDCDCVAAAYLTQTIGKSRNLLSRLGGR